MLGPAGIVLALIGAKTLGGCSPTTGVLAGRAFLSVSVTDGGAARQLVAGTRIRLGFDEETVTISAGCNSLGGQYTIDGTQLVLGNTFTTEMGCAPDLMAQDGWLSTFLGSKPTIVLIGSDLTLSGGSTVIKLVDRKVAEPDVALTAAPWQVESIIAGDAVSSVPDGATATLRFNDDGTVTVDDGCNQGNAHWQAVGGGLEISELVLIKKACDGLAAALEAAVTGVLRGGTISAAIDADVLTLQAGAAGLQLRAVRA